MSSSKQNSAITMKIIDSKAFDDKESITDLISLGDKFLVVKPNGVYQVLLPEEIDRENVATDTKPTYIKLHSIGSNDLCLKLGFLQFKSLIDFSAYKDKIFNHLWETTQYLLKCEESLKYIYNETEKGILQCKKIIEESKQKAYVPLFPTIPLLDNHIDQFLINAKHCLINIFQEFHIIFKTPNYESNFEAYCKWFEERKEKYPEIHLALQENITWIKKTTNLRNAKEHPKEGQKIEVSNITFLPGNKFQAPSWKYNLSRKGCGKQEDFSDMTNDMRNILSNILNFQENITALCLDQELKDMKIGVRICKKDNSPN